MLAIHAYKDPKAKVMFLVITPPYPFPLAGAQVQPGSSAVLRSVFERLRRIPIEPPHPEHVRLTRRRVHTPLLFLFHYDGSVIGGLLVKPIDKNRCILQPSALSFPCRSLRQASGRQ